MARRPRDPKRVSVSVRLTEATAARLREFVRYHRGHPFFLELGPFVEQAIIAEMQRIDLKLSGAMPMDERQQKPRRAINSVDVCHP